MHAECGGRGASVKAKYYDEDKDFLLDFEDQVQHYTVVARASSDS
jgi:hypothetical protein